MDTVEELNNTYFYAGRSNLSASQLGVQDFGAIVSIVAGLNNFAYTDKTAWCH